MSQTITIKRRERDAVLQSLQAGLVPKQGLHLIQVGRKAEVTALIADLDRIADEGASFRICVGRFGSGKSFFLNLVRTVAFQKKLAVAQADFTMNRRLHSTGGEARALYSELMRNLATRTHPDGGALPSILLGWASRIQHGVLESGGTPVDAERRMRDDLREFQSFVGGFEFAEVAQAYYRGHILGDETLQASALRWLRAEYDSKMEARQDLGVRRIILDENFLESLKLMAAFLRRAGYAGLLVNLDEMVVLSHRLPNSRARQSNYEALLSLLNDSFQGSAKGLGFIFAGTDDCLEDKRRGLFSYEALRSRLAENTFARGEGLTDLSGPVIRLQPLTPEDLFVLLRNIALVHAGGNPAKVITPDDAIAAVLQKANETLGAGFFRTPRDIVRGFIGLLNILDQNPDRTWQSVLSATTFKTPATAASTEEEVANGQEFTPADADDDLSSFRL